LCRIGRLTSAHSSRNLGRIAVRSSHPDVFTLGRKTGLSAAARSCASATAGAVPTNVQQRLDLDIPRCREEVRRVHSAAERLATGALAYSEPRARWHWLDRELSSNIAGETGAVYIYHGASAGLSLRAVFGGSRGTELTEAELFVREHLRAEAEHLALFEELLPESKRTRLLPLWRTAGWLLGFLPSLLSPRLLFHTIAAVEAFVEEHYMAQILPLERDGRSPELVKLLRACCADEVHHKEDAQRRAGAEPPSLPVRVWRRIVGVGSAVAADVARRV